MSGSGTIRVLKRDGSVELFDVVKLSGVLWRAIRPSGHPYERARYLGDAVMFYLSRDGSRCVSSAAIFEMCVRLLQHVGFAEAATAFQGHRSWRQAKRKSLRVTHEGLKVTLWDKSWLAGFAQRCWHLSPGTARTIAGEIEAGLLAGGEDQVSRFAVIEMLNERVAAYGLADAVPADR
jgi:hypothetical protein